MSYWKSTKDLFEDIEECGATRIEKFSISEEEARRYNLRVVYDFNERSKKSVSDTFVYPGDYIRLVIDNRTMMSDTQFEYITNKDFIDACKGEVLIFGLGLGLLPNTIKDKVESMDIVEYSPEVLTLVKPKLEFIKNLNIIQGDMNEYIPEKKYDYILMDIWDNITSDLDEIREIEKKRDYFKKFLKKGGKVFVWGENYHRETKRIEKKRQKEIESLNSMFLKVYEGIF